MDGSNVFSGFLGTILGVIAGALTNRYKIDSRAEVIKFRLAADADTKRRDAELKTIHEQQQLLLDEQKRVRQALMEEVLDLRQYILQVQKELLVYVKENGEFRAQVVLLTHENNELRASVEALMRENTELKSRIVVLEHSAGKRDNGAHDVQGE